MKMERAFEPHEGGFGLWQVCQALCVPEPLDVGLSHDIEQRPYVEQPVALVALVELIVATLPGKELLEIKEARFDLFQDLIVVVDV